MLTIPAALVVAGLAVARPPAPGPQSGAISTIRIEAKDFAFNPAAIRVEQGDRVTIELAPGDVVHGLHIEGYDVKLTADPGQTASVSFVADRPGSFRIRCNVPCGPLHPFMAGRLRVGPPRALWASLLLACAAVILGGGAFAGGSSRTNPRLPLSRLPRSEAQ